MEYVRITWRDSTLVERYQEGVDKALCISTITTVGMVIEENTEFVAVARDDHDEVYRAVVVIPTFAITAREGMRVA